MSSPEPTAALAAILEQEAIELQALHAAMQRTRMAFVALRGSELAGAAAHLSSLAASVLALEKQRAELLATLGKSGQPPALAALVAAAPPEPGRRLQRAADAVRRAAGALRVENGVGMRLLDFSRRTQESLFQALVRAGETRSYDRHARAVTAAEGNLLSGNV